MISINNLTVSFGGFTLFDKVNFHINDDDKIGLVGKNGSGKTTLLKLIAGVTTPVEGSVQRPSSITMGYLPQEMEYTRDVTVIQETLKVFNHLKELDNQLHEVNNQICQRTDYHSDEYHNLIIKLNEINDKINSWGNINPLAECEKVLKGLGFVRDEFDRERATLSQGWNMRIELAKILLSKPDVMLLDEPTNHLDIESIKWLESYLFQYKGALLLISHDRRFLDSLTKRTVEISMGKINDYKVPYTKYTLLRKERMEQIKAAYENQQKLIEKTEDFIERFRYKASKSNQVQSRIKQLDKLDRIEIEEEDKSRIFVKFPPAPRAGKVVVKATDIKMCFPQKTVFEGANLVIERGDKVALLGKNGEGKSTFMKILTGKLKPTTGKFELGHNVSLGYYAQNQEELLNRESTVYETLDRVAVGDIRTKLRDILGAILFRGEDIDKKTAVLSGGEKSRLAMATLMLHPYNLLALDEPTNHMDIRSKDILKQALIKYDGTMVLVSHDRDFLDGLVNKIYEFKDGRVKEHLGTLEEFLSSVTQEEESIQVVQKPLPKAAVKPVSSQKRDETAKAVKKIKTKIENCEKEIEEFESQIIKLEEELSVKQELKNLNSLLAQYDNAKRELQMKMEEWERLHLKMNSYGE